MLALVFANGFFVAAEFSIVTVRKTRIDQLIAEGHRARAPSGGPSPIPTATSPRRSSASPWRASASAGSASRRSPSLIQPALTFLPAGVAEATAHSIAVAIAFAIITALHIMLGELAPKTIALERPEATALIVVEADRAVHEVSSGRSSAC